MVMRPSFVWHFSTLPQPHPLVREGRKYKNYFVTQGSARIVGDACSTLGCGVLRGCATWGSGWKHRPTRKKISDFAATRKNGRILGGAVMGTYPGKDEI
jgi:hypothetical protein